MTLLLFLFVSTVTCAQEPKFTSPFGNTGKAGGTDSRTLDLSTTGPGIGQDIQGKPLPFAVDESFSEAPDIAEQDMQQDEKEETPTPFVAEIETKKSSQPLPKPAAKKPGSHSDPRKKMREKETKRKQYMLPK